MNNSTRIHLSMLFFGICLITNAQVLIDQGIQVNGLWCFPVHKKVNTYQYLPQRARLSLKNDSMPEFSFMRYILEKPTENSLKTITQADGGAILNFLVLYDTPASLVASAQKSLRKKLENDSIKLQDPILFNKGRYTLVSSILNPENGEEKSKLLASGTAPIMENSKIPLTFNLDPLNSKLLLESFKMDTPDVSLLFELSFSGLSNDYEAEVEVDWAEVKKSKAFEGGVDVYFVATDVELGFDKLRKDQAIKFTSTGNNNSMESLVETAYSKLLGLMFKPVERKQMPPEQLGGLTNMLGSVLGQGKNRVGENAKPFSVHVGYQLKEHNTTGKSKLRFNGRSSVTRNHYITFNAGDLFNKYGDNESIFKDVPLWDPAFQQREVYVGIDGELEKEFGKMLNSVTLQLKKKHQSGQVVTKEILITKDFYQDSTKQAITYLNDKDLDRTRWLEYKYRTIWNFIGGKSYDEGWMKGSSAMINLYVPFKRRKIELTGDMSALKEEDVRAVSVQLEYDFFGEKKAKNTTLYPSETLEEKYFEVTVPKGAEDVNYSLTWFIKGGSPKSRKGVDSHGLIFIDELPKSQ